MIRICFVMVLLPDSPVPKIDQNRNYLFIRFLGYKSHMVHKSTEINETTLNILKLCDKTPRETKSRPVLHLRQRRL